MSRPTKLEAMVLRAWVNLAPNMPIPRHNYRFDLPHSRREIDWAWPEAKVGIEVQGGVHINGAHVRARGLRADYEKLNDLIDDDWKVFYLTTDMVVDDPMRTLTIVQRTLQERLPEDMIGMPDEATIKAAIAEMYRIPAPKRKRRRKPPRLSSRTYPNFPAQRGSSKPRRGK